jgi:hypothetical protein
MATKQTTTTSKQLDSAKTAPAVELAVAEPDTSAWQRAFDGLGTAVFVLTADHTVSDLNAAAKEALRDHLLELQKLAPDLRPDSVIGASLAPMLTGLSPELGAALDDVRHFPAQVAIMLGGNRIVLGLRALQDDAGAPAGNVLEWRDDTDRHLGLQSIGEASGILKRRSDEIRSAASEVREATLEQLAGVNQTTAAVAEITQVAREAVSRSEQVIKEAEEANAIYQDGRQAVEGNIASMNEIKSQMESIAETIVDLSERTQAIGDIITSVKDIAEQSNLLALNASIEAARAGDQGRGFAVVATEMRSLAEQSKQATNQVRTILGEIQRAATEAVRVAEMGGQIVAKGVEQAMESGGHIEALAQAIEKQSFSAQQIAASTRQQQLGMEQISDAIARIEGTAAGAQAASDDLTHQAEKLQSFAGELKTIITDLS